MMSTSTCVGEEIDQTRFTIEPEIQAESEPVILEIETLCPFCGTFNSGIGKPCVACKRDDNPATRAATAQKSGPWCVLKANSADADEVDFEQLRQLIGEGKFTAGSVVRGPTTGQLWRLACKVRGLSREFGLCYCCNGDIETEETVCPHCDRSQTVPAQAAPAAPAPAAPAPAAPAPAIAAENHKEVREALLSEPVIHVHSLSHPDHTPVDPVMAARPVVAECTERHFPKDDLLTPRDVAKAFQLEFGLQEEQINRHLSRPDQTRRMLKIIFTSGSAIGLAILLLWPMTRVVSSWINATPARTYRAIPVGTTFADTRFSNNTLVTLPNQGEVPALAPAPSYVAMSRPMVAGAVLTPTPLIEPTPTLSAEDDPRLLWINAMEAESAGNYRAAVESYERIESLSSDLWPAHLEVRLALARKELKGDVR